MEKAGHQAGRPGPASLFRLTTPEPPGPAFQPGMVRDVMLISADRGHTSTD